MLGAGHFGLESFGIGCLVLIGLVNYLVITVAPAELFGAQQPQASTCPVKYGA
jgi:hypothetical protein